MRTSSAEHCACGGRFVNLFSYPAPPPGETRLPSQAGPYHREVRRCDRCLHCISVHAMDLSALYRGEYVSATYGPEGMRPAFDRIQALPPSKSDNAGRVARVRDFAEARFAPGSSRSVLDVGSGLCVFLQRMKAAGWDCCALDPDERAAAHAREVVKVDAICGDFRTLELSRTYDVVTFNKVLEHVEDPVQMLSRAKPCLSARGFVYVELPDAEAAALHGSGREEFFIEHLHIFSGASMRRLATDAGFRVETLERLQEPSSKFTLRAFLLPG